MILATAVAAPVMIICCGGGLAFVASAATGLIAQLSGSDVVLSVLVAAVAGLFAYFLRHRLRLSVGSGCRETIGKI
jgi:membrane protein implicated in regulation of membrane protease activity